MTEIVARPATPADRHAVEDLLIGSWGELRVAANGRIYHLATLPALVAVDPAGHIVGVLTYQVDGDSLEVVTIDAAPPRQGAGTILLLAAEAVAIERGLRTLWLVTTNDNLDAMRFYQRRGLHIIQVRPGGVSASRALKPSIPLIGAYGIPIRDEIILGRSLPVGVEL